MRYWPFGNFEMNVWANSSNHHPLRRSVLYHLSKSYSLWASISLWLNGYQWLLATSSCICGKCFENNCQKTTVMIKTALKLFSWLFLVDWTCFKWAIFQNRTKTSVLDFELSSSVRIKMGGKARAKWMGIKSLWSPVNNWVLSRYQAGPFLPMSF